MPEGQKGDRGHWHPDNLQHVPDTSWEHQLEESTSKDLSQYVGGERRSISREEKETSRDSCGNYQFRGDSH